VKKNFAKNIAFYFCKSKSVIAKILFNLAKKYLQRHIEAKQNYFGLKGTVQRKLTGVESDINRKSSLRIEPLIFLFYILRETCSLNSKKTVSAAKAKICGLSNSMGHPLQITDSVKPIQIHS
jgi:hypothetical protein